MVQRLICDNILQPTFEPILIYDNGACRKNKGTHFTLNRTKKHFRDFYNKHGIDGWVFKADISNYFHSIPHSQVKQTYNKRIKDPSVVSLLDMFLDATNEDYFQKRMMYYQEKYGVKIITQGKGLPLGNMTNQWFSITHLHPLDIFIKQELKIKYYSRYMDDFIIIHEDKEYLKYCKSRIEQKLLELELTLHPKSQILPIRNGIDYVGFHIYITSTGKIILKLRRDSKNRMNKKVKRYNQSYKDGTKELHEIKQSVASWVGHAKFGNTYNLRKKIIGKLVLSKTQDTTKPKGGNKNDKTI